MAPFFSIGVTTFDREEMLKDTLDSILGQGFGDYEVVVSNDNPQRQVTAGTLAIKDPRFKFINQKVNLGELNNLNYLLKESTGRYFTWIADDDLYMPDFLESAHRALIKYSLPDCVFTSYKVFNGDNFKICEGQFHDNARLFDGAQFLLRHTRGKAKAISTMGIFDRRLIQDMGGLEDISRDGKGMYCEYMLLVKCALLKRVAYIDRPLVLFRSHSGSWGKTSIDFDMYQRAVENLTRQSIEIFSSPPLKKNFYAYIYFILKLAISSILGIMSRREKLGDKSIKKALVYLVSAKRYIEPLKKSGLYLTGLIALIHAEISLVLSAGARFMAKSLNVTRRKQE